MRRTLTLAVLALALVGPRERAVSAQPRYGVAGSHGPERRAGSNALKDQLGIPAAMRLIGADDPAARLRGIERLGSLGASEPLAIDALVEAMDQSSPAMRDPRARLTAVRVL